LAAYHPRASTMPIMKGPEELSNTLVDTSRIEFLIQAGFVCGACMLVTHSLFSPAAKKSGGRVEKVFVEIQRKSFHMIGGCIICAAYHWGLKHGYLISAYRSASMPAVGSGSNAMDAGAAFLAVSLATWMLEASRLMIPAVQRWYMDSFKGLVREKERTKAAGIAYFLPGTLAAMLAAPSHVAILSILFLSVGDAAASIGTAAGTIPVGSSSRKVEGSIGCFLVCAGLAAFAGLSADVAIVTSALVTLGEVLAEVIGLDDNFVIPLLGVLGVRIGLFPQLSHMLGVMVVGLAIGVSLGGIVSASKSSRK